MFVSGCLCSLRASGDPQYTPLLVHTSLNLVRAAHSNIVRLSPSRVTIFLAVSGKKKHGIPGKLVNKHLEGCIDIELGPVSAIIVKI